MSVTPDDLAEAGLILAAEECPPESFEQLHSFSKYDETIIRKLIAHGPVLVRGGRGSGKSALLIESHRRMKDTDNSFSSYISLRYLPLLQSDGDEYIGHFCLLLSGEIEKELSAQQIDFDFGSVSEQGDLKERLMELSQFLGKRIVLLFDDAAHIGREKSLEVFFDLFRTLSSSVVSCKASIYPGVTRFGVRFDVYNDSTVIDISRSDISSDSDFFPDVVKARYPKLANRAIFSDRFSPRNFANLLGRAVVGNLRGFILACNRFEEVEKIGIPEVTECFLNMATDYFWPLMDEVEPKLGVYEPQIETARQIMNVIVDHATKPVRDRHRAVAQDRVLIHRQTVTHFNKAFEILEYLGFIARLEASRSLKSGGRGPVFAINLCNLLEEVPTRRLTFDMIEEWLDGQNEAAEIHSSSQAFQQIRLPAPIEEQGLAILSKSITALAKSPVYPYGLTDNMLWRLEHAGYRTVGAVAMASDEELDRIYLIGIAKIQRIRDVVYQAIWM
jgi:hypothetical protein